LHHLFVAQQRQRISSFAANLYFIAQHTFKKSKILFINILYGMGIA